MAVRKAAAWFRQACWVDLVGKTVALVDLAGNLVDLADNLVDLADS